MTSLLSKIRNNKNINSEFLQVINNLHARGPIDYGDMEVLSYTKLYQPHLFEQHEKTILNLMGLYFKKGLSDDDDIRGLISNLIGKGINEKYGHAYTPVQANLIENLTDKKLFSFSSATSTGKSHVFRDLIMKQRGDMIIVVPSRALINEYFVRVLKLVENERVNVLVFPDIVNTALAERSVFILTPERVKDIFRLKDRLRVATVLFDEAQMAEEEGRRGIYFDSIVRRMNEHFTEAKLLFAQPYIDNPGAQFTRNKLADDLPGDNNRAYPYRNVGQIFTCIDEDKYYHFAIDKTRLGNTKLAIGYDPIARCLDEDGAVLVYVPKSHIYDGRALSEMSRYTENLSEITDEDAIILIDKISDLLGGSPDYEDPYHSDLLSLLSKGIVVHHGSLPLQARFLVEEFINKGHCRICFATSTLYQGVNMPFDIVYLKKLDGSKPLLVKNLIGRAGRSTNEPIFDYGQVIVKASRMSELRSVLSTSEKMSDESQIDIDQEEDDAELKEFKEAIRNNHFDDNYNLTNLQVERLASEGTAGAVSAILNILFDGDKSIDAAYKDLNLETRQYVIDLFKQIFRMHVKNRDISDGESAVISNAIAIFMLQIRGRNLKSIVESRFGHITRMKERRSLEKIREAAPGFYLTKLRTLKLRNPMPAETIPNEKLSVYGMFDYSVGIGEAGYDRVMYDTYDYIDKVWGFCLADVFYAAFDLFDVVKDDARAKTMCKYIRYATINETEIWLLRYGFSFEEIEWIKPLVRDIGEAQIVFGDISQLEEDQLAVIARYLPNSHAV